MGARVIFGDFLKALGQMGDGRFIRVLVLGAVLALALLAGLSFAFLWVVEAFAPDTLDLPWIGSVTRVDAVLGWASFGLMIVLSVFLMVPVAAAFAGLFLEDVAEAVEDRHYPDAPPAPKLRLAENVVGAVNFLGVVVAVNAVAFVLYLFAGFAAPLVFWIVNGYLLGREYFSTVATPRLGRVAAANMRKRHRGTIWTAGILMAAPLSIPFVNLLVPVLGAATFTHLFHRLARLRT